MRNLQNLAVVSSLAIGSLAAAQNAVEWRVADGGNGHWYRFVSGPVDCFAWWQANAESSGAHLASIGSVSEQTFLGGLLPGATGGFVGGTRSPESDANLGWTWVTGEPFSPMAVSWAPGNPGCCAPNEFWLRLLNNGLHDGAECENGTAAFFEWSADCNNDGLVDYGQILAGSLPDANQNNIPDCCEAGSPCPDSAVQWRVADGGNGHWYQRIDRNDQSWTALRALCEARGGHLVSITSAAESSMAVAVMAGQRCIIGGFQDRKAPNYVEPAGGWRWCTNEPIEWSNWNQAEPNNATGLGEDIMAAYPSGLWVDLSNLPGDVGWPVSFAIIEYEADCNADGLIDYGQILAGSLPDSNHNNIPDCCEGGASCNPCPGDVDNSGAVNGVDLAAILNTWGTSGGKYPGADVNHDGIVNGTDLAEVLNGWGPCH